MTQLPAPMASDLPAQIAALAAAHRRANGPVMALLNRLGGGVEQQMTRLPPRLRLEIERITRGALLAAHDLAAIGTRAPDIGRQGPMLAAIATGAAGGAGGMASALAELPVTITVILHAIRAEARRVGFDPDSPLIRASCLEVFAAGSPLASDDGINTAFLSARLTVNGAALQKIIASAAPRLAAALGPKLAAQAVPVLGALSGAALNAAYLRYYRETARIRFALMRLAERHGVDPVLEAFTAATAARPVSRA